MKKVLKLFCLVALFFCFSRNVSAVEQSVIFKESNNFADNNNIRFDNAGSTYKTAELSNGTIVMAYCFNHQLEAPPIGNKIYLRDLNANEIQRKNSFLYILNNGWNGKTWNRTGSYTNDEKYYITQLAIWGLQGSYGGGIDLNSLNANNSKKVSIKQAAISFLNDALKHNSQGPITMDIEPSESVMKLSDDKSYFISQNFKVVGSGYKNYKVTLENAPLGTEIIVPSKNLVKKTGDLISYGDEFYIKVPVQNIKDNLNINIKIDSTGSIQDLYIYQYNNSYQDVGIAVNKSVSIYKTAKVSIPALGGLMVRKVAVNAAGEETDLKGAQISVSDSSGREIANWNTLNENPKTINNLPLGVYRITEVKAPDGYTEEEYVNVEVKSNQIVEVKLKNIKDRKPIYISKVDATTDIELPGAHLVLKDSTGSIVEEWDSETTPHLVAKELTPGIYKLIETIAPKGYQKTTEIVTFKVNNDGYVDEKVVMKNKPITSIKISKKDITTKKELPGATLIVKNSEGKIIDEWVSTTEPHYLPENLEPGKYVLIEKIAPEGYGISEDVIEFEVNNNGVEKTIVMNNSPIPVTADMPIVLVIISACIAVLLALLSMFKVGKESE